jgi:hypothetical protein
MVMLLMLRWYKVHCELLFIGEEQLQWLTCIKTSVTRKTCNMTSAKETTCNHTSGKGNYMQQYNSDTFNKPSVSHAR